MNSPIDALTHREEQGLLRFAREVVAAHLWRGPAPGSPNGVSEALLSLRTGMFVTLRIEGSLRGCIGHIVSRGVLLDELRELAVAAAVRDHRFRPLTTAELDVTQFEISLLTPPEAVSDASQIRLGVDGVILTQGYRSAVFLPEVPVEQGWTITEMLTALSGKAGLAPNAWKSPGARFETFQSVHFGENVPEPRG